MAGLIDTSGLLAGAGKILDQLFTSDEEKAKAKLAMAQLEQLPALKQAEITLQEAKHKSLFVAGWRPAVGWVCAAGFAYQFVLRPLLAWVLMILQGLGVVEVVPETLPLLSLTDLGAIFLALLGYGTARTVEKIKGVANPGVSSSER